MSLRWQSIPAIASLPLHLEAARFVRPIMETVGPHLTPAYRMPRFFRWPSTRAETFSQAAILLVVLSVYFDRLTMVIAGSRSTTAWTQGMASMRSWLLPMDRSLPEIGR